MRLRYRASSTNEILERETILQYTRPPAFRVVVTGFFAHLLRGVPVKPNPHFSSYLRQLHQRWGAWVAFVLDLAHSLMGRVQDSISPVLGLTLKDLRRGVSRDFLLTLLSLALLTYFIWGFDYVDSLYDSIVLNLLPAALPPLAFFDAMRQGRKGRRFSWWNAGIAFFLALGVGLAFSDKFDLDTLGINLVTAMVSSPWLVIFVAFVRDKRILAIGMVPAAIILMAYWSAPTYSSDLELHYLPIPLSTVSFVTAAWTGLVWIFFKGVDKWPCHRTLRPLMESLAMLLLFMPLMALAIWVPRTLTGGNDWSVVVAAIVGVVFGSVVSEPLGRFLRSYGNLPSHRSPAGNSAVKQGQDAGGCGRE